jgi:hypothetical protein
MEALTAAVTASTEARVVEAERKAAAAEEALSFAKAQAAEAKAEAKAHMGEAKAQMEEDMRLAKAQMAEDMLRAIGQAEESADKRRHFGGACLVGSANEHQIEAQTLRGASIGSGQK